MGIHHLLTTFHEKQIDYNQRLKKVMRAREHEFFFESNSTHTRSVTYYSNATLRPLLRNKICQTKQIEQNFLFRET